MLNTRHHKFVNFRKENLPVRTVHFRKSITFESYFRKIEHVPSRVGRKTDVTKLRDKIAGVTSV